MSEVSVSYASDAPLMFVQADGGSRRERGSAIGAVIRRLRREGLVLEHYHTGYDEAWGFQTRTEARYKITNR